MPRIGIMLEVPAMLYQLDDVAKRVDFVSVGSNDLTQYLLAVDRNNPRVSSLFDSYHPEYCGLCIRRTSIVDTINSILVSVES